MKEREFMDRAVDEARKSRDEDDQRPHPRVGVVVVKDGTVLATAHRGEQEPGEHAEFTALEKKLKDCDVSGATVFTTLEPCTSRRHPKVPCAERLLQRRIDRVVIGMLDPNREIRGRGEWLLFEHGIKIGRFDPDLMDSLRDLNRDFIRAHQRLGLRITSPKDGAKCYQRECLVKGTFTNPPGENVAAITYVRGRWWPQLSPVRVPPSANNEWEIPVEFGIREPHQVCIVQANELGLELIRYYRHVASHRDEVIRRAAACTGRSEGETLREIWPHFVALSMARLPQGLDIEDRITVNAMPNEP